MEKPKNLSPKLRALIIAIAVVCLGALGAVIYAAMDIEKVASEDDYAYENPDETKAQPDEGMTIDGVLDEEVYKNNTWLYLHNESGGAPVDIAMTSWYGEKGMYFVYDVTEETPIYVNLDRASYLNSGIEMYLAPSYVSSLQDNSVFEIDMLPTGDMVFKKTNGKGGYTKVTSTNDITAYLGATTKGGEVNTEDCYGYCLELFIPWEYMEWLDMDVESMKESFAYVNPAHITSYNETGTDTSVDRFWYYFVQQKGASFGSVASYFRFDETGALDTAPVTLVEGDHYTIFGPKTVIPGMEVIITIKAEDGYALNSILVNNEEQIKKVSFNEDGTVVLTLKGQKEGLNISVATEPVTEGNKTLSGVINVNKYGGDSYEGVSASYKGPNGERPIEFDSNGNFVLADLKQGYYEILVEKEGYDKVVRGIYLNRDFETIIDLEYPYFETISGTAWGLEEQNKGVLIKNPGSGVILSTDSFNKFTVEANFMYDAELAEESQDNYYFQQRSGFRIEFSNGKYWHINLMNEGGTYRVQYAKHTKENSIFGWKNIHDLTEEEIAKYQSAEGIELSVLRDGKYANVYLDGKLIAIEVLADEYEDCTARLGFEGWVANPEAVEIPFKISKNVNVNIRNPYFINDGGFDITGQYDNVIILPNGGRANIDFADKYVNMDLTLTVQDYADPEGTGARTDVLFVFDNGAHVSFGVCKDGDVYRIQSLNRNANDGKQIYNRFKSHGVLTEEEAEKYLNGGVDFRILRIGTEITLYIDDRMVAVCDLTNNNSGVKPTDEATITIRHYDDAGVKVELPFEITETMETVTINCPAGALGQMATEKQTYVLGDTVVVKGAGKAGYYCTGLKANGKAVDLNWDGTYTFTATEKTYTLEGTFDERTFVDSNKWNVLKQNQGIISLPNGGDAGYLDFYQKYTNMDLTLTVKDYAGETDSETAIRTVVKYIFDNEETASFSILAENGGYIVQSMGDSIFGWKTHYRLSEEEAAKVKDDGIDFRVVRVGTEVYIYLDGKAVCTGLDLTTNRAGEETGITAEDAATVTIRHYGDTGVHVEIPFEVTDELNLVTFTDNSTNGHVVVDGIALVGTEVTLKGAAQDGYFLKALKVDGKNVSLNWDGTYTFTATKTNYTVEGTFVKAVFVDNDDWNLLEQDEGVVSLPIDHGNSPYLEFIEKYTDMHLTLSNLRDYDAEDDTGFSYAVKLHFDDVEKDVIFRLTYDSGIYGIQSMGGTYVYKWFYQPMSEEEVVALQSEDGIDFEVVRYGSTVYFYIEGKRVGNGVDLTVDKDGNATGITADMEATISIKSDGNEDHVVEIPFTITDKLPLVTLTGNSTNGSIINVGGIALVGDEVTIKGKGDDGYFCKALKVDGKNVSLNWDGTYTFTATKTSYAVEGTFAEAVFVDNDGWNLLNQDNGKVSLPVDHGNSSYLEFYEKYKDMDLNLTLRDYIKDNSTGFSYAVKMHFADADKDVIFRLTYDSGIFGIQSMGGAYGWKWFYQPMTTEEVAALQSEAGIDFRIVRSGTDVFFYLNGRRVCDTIDLTEQGIDEDMEATVSIKSDGNKGHEVEIPFTVDTVVPETVAIYIVESTEGTITTKYRSYLVGDTVDLVITPAEGYNRTGLVVKQNGTVVADETGVVVGADTFSFTATETSYEVEATYVEEIFADNANWDLTGQYDGVLSTDHQGATGYMSTMDNYNTLSMTIWNPEGSIDDYSIAAQFVFANGQIVNVQVLEWKDAYIVKSANGSSLYGGNDEYFRLTDEQIAAVKGDGLKLTIARTGTDMLFYLGEDRVESFKVGGVTVDSMDLTKDKDGNETEITADMTAKVEIASWTKDADGTAVEISFELSEDEAATVDVNVADTEHGIISTDKRVYLPGETVILSVNSDNGYAYNSLTINGADARIELDGTYSFEATESSYTITGGFAPVIFSENNKWNTVNQHFGVLTSVTQGDTGYIATLANNYNVVSLTLCDKDGATDTYGVAVLFEFANEKKFHVQVYKWRDNYYVKSAESGSLYGGNYEYFRLSAEQIEKIKTTGVKFTVARAGTDILLYMDDVRVEGFKTVDGASSDSFDLTKDMNGAATGITADMTATVQIESHCADAEMTSFDIPFELSTTAPETAVVNIAASTNGTVTSDKRVYLKGDTVTITATPGDDYNRTGLVVKCGDEVVLENQNVVLGEEKITFIADKTGTYTVAAEFTKEIFEDNDKLDLSGQYNGVISSTYQGNTGYTATLDSYNTVTLNINNPDGAMDYYCFDVQYVFETGEVLHIQVLEWNNIYRVKTIGIGTLCGNNKEYFRLDADAVEGNGVELKIARTGTNVLFYVDGERVESFTVNDVTVDSIDLTKDYNGNVTQITATTPATINFQSEATDTDGVALTVPFILSKDELQTAGVNIVTPENGTISSDDKRVYVVGETIPFTISPATGYNRTSLVVKHSDGTVEYSNDEVAYGEVLLNIPVEKAGTYTIEATFVEKVFKDNTVWDLSKQHTPIDEYQGSIIRNVGEKYNTFIDLAKEYTNIHFTSLVKMSASNSYIVRMYFNEADGTSKNVVFQIYNNDKSDATNGSWVLKSWGDSYGGNREFCSIPSSIASKLVNEGLKFEVARVGAKAYVYMDGQRIWDVDLTGVTDTATTQVRVRLDEAVESTIEIPFAIYTDVADRSAVYVASAGSDATLNGLETAPVATLEYALSIVDEGGTIYVQDAIDVPSNTLEAEFAKSITIEGVDTDSDNVSNGELNFTATGDIDLKSAMTFTNVKMTFTAKAKIFAWGNRLEIAEDVTGIEKTGTDGLGIYAGGRKTAVDSTEVILKAGTYRVVYGGGWRGAVNGDTHVTISHNANIDTNIDYTSHDGIYCVYGGSEDADVTGNTYVTIGNTELGDKNVSRFHNIYGGGRNTSLVDTGRVLGNCYVTYYGYAMSVYGGTQNATTDTTPILPHVEGNTYVTMNGGYAQQIFGGCEQGSMVGNTNIIVEEGEVVRRIYGGCYNENPLTDSYSVQGHTNVKIGLGVTLGLDYENDNSLYAISRKTTLADNEWGTFIFNKDDADKDRTGNHDTGLETLAFPGQAYHYLVVTNGNDASGEYGTINPADDKLNIVPATGKIAEITIDSVTSYFGEGLYTLPTLSTKSDKMTIEINFVDQSTVGNFIASVNGTLYTDVDMAVGEANKEGAIVNILDDSKMGKLTIADCENGSVTTETPYYAVGNDVTITLAADKGYAYNKLQINDGNTTTDIRVDYDGNYSFKATEGAYTITAEFAEAPFNPTDGWYVNNQLFGDITQIKDSSEDANSTWLGTNKKYVNFDLTLDVKEYADANALTRTYVEIKFADGTKYRYSIAKNGNETDGYRYTIQPDYANDVYTLDATEIASIKDEDRDGKGLEFRIVRQGTTLSVHLNGVYVCSQEIAASRATEEAQIVIRRYDDIGEQITIPFELSTEGTEATFTNTITDGVISSFENGTVTLNKTSGNYVVGEKVTLTVAGANTDSDLYPEYYYDSLVVNGKTVMVDNDGNFTFVAQKENTITATFKEALFDGSSDSGNTWHLMNQHFGIITQNGAKCSGTTADLKFAESYTYSDLSIKVKAGEDDFNADGSLKDAGGNRIAVRYFANNTNYGYSIILDPNDGNYYVRTSGTANNYVTNLYSLSEAQNAKIKTGDGIIFRLVQLEGRIYIYLDDELVYDADLAFGTTAAVPAIRNYDDGGLTIPMEYSFATVDESTGEAPNALFTNTVNNKVISFENGTITLDKDGYVVGEPVILTIAGSDTNADGYADFYYDSLTVNGKTVMVDNDGTFTFVAQKENTITATFKEALFDGSSDSGNTWHLINQHFGIITQNGTKCSGASADLKFAESYTYSDLSIKVKAGEDDFNADGSLKDAGGNRIAVRYFANNTNYGYSIILDPNDGNYYVRTSGTANNYVTNLYSLSEAQNEKIKTGDGIIFRLVQLEGRIYIYLDDELVYDADLAFGTTAAVPAIRNYDDGGLTIPMEYAFSDDVSSSAELFAIVDNTQNVSELTILASFFSFLSLLGMSLFKF